MPTEDIWYIVLVIGVSATILSALLLLRHFVIASIKRQANKSYLKKVFLAGSALLALFHIIGFALGYMAFTNSPNPLKAIPLATLAGIVITAELMRELYKQVKRLEEVHHNE